MPHRSGPNHFTQNVIVQRLSTRLLFPPSVIGPQDPALSRAAAPMASGLFLCQDLAGLVRHGFHNLEDRTAVIGRSAEGTHGVLIRQFQAAGSSFYIQDCCIGIRVLVAFPQNIFQEATNKHHLCHHNHPRLS